MARRPSDKPQRRGNWFDELIAEGLQRLDTKLTVIEFARDILNFKLMVPQSAILKAFYGLELEEPEREWLDKMVAENKSTWRPGRSYQVLVVEAGMRSSKTTIASIIVAYEAFELYQLPNPAEHYGLHPGSPLFITTVATTQQQSKDTVFGYTKARIEDSPYFKTLMDKGEVFVNDDRIEFPKKRLTIIGGHSNQAGMVGKTAKAFVMDEAARFKDTSTGESNAKSMYSNVGRSTISFKEHGKKIIISSAWEEGDVMEWLYEMADPDQNVTLDDGTEVEQNMLAFRLCTWDLNTTLSRKDFVNDYRMDEVAARRDYEGIRPGSVENFFVKEKLVQAAKGDSCADWLPSTIEVGARKYVGISIPHIEPVTFPIYSYAHADPGLKKDSFGFAVGHPMRTQAGVVAVIDLVVEWAPKDQGRGVVWPVSYEDVERVIWDVHKARNIRRLTTDHWQQAGLVQRMYSKGVVTQEIHFSGETQLMMYQTARQMFNAGRVILPKDAEKALKELIHIQLLRGKKIDHPRKNPDETPGSKDLADCIVSVIYQCAEEERLFMSGGAMKNPVKSIGKTHVAHVMQNAARTNMRDIRFLTQ